MVTIEEIESCMKPAAESSSPGEGEGDEEQEMEPDFEALDRLLLPMDAAVPYMPEVSVSSEEAWRLSNGMWLRTNNLEQYEYVKLSDPDGVFVKVMENGTLFFAIAELRQYGETLHPVRLLFQAGER
jgi:tRNA U55 pseudouridine synthase TruB